MLLLKNAEIQQLEIIEWERDNSAQNMIMTNSGFKALGLFIPIVLLFSCSAPVKVLDNQVQSKEESGKIFIETVNGVKHNVSSIKQAGTHNGTFTLDDGSKLAAKDVKAFQNEVGYYKNVGEDFAVRVKTGAIEEFILIYSEVLDVTNVAYDRSRSGTQVRQRKAFFIQKNGGEIVRLTPEILADYVKQNASAKAIMDEYMIGKKKYDSPLKLLIPKMNAIKKNEAKLDLAIDEYNKNPS